MVTPINAVGSLVCPRMPNACPEPGIYPSVPEGEYFKWAAVSATMLSKARRTLGHLRHWMFTTDEGSSSSTEFGRLGHAALLEPERFAASIIPAPVHESGRHAGKPFGVESQAYQAYLADHPGKFVLSEDHRAALDSIRRNVAKTTYARNLLAGDGQNEIALVWIDGETGLPCKARVDRRIVRSKVDLKFLRSAELYSVANAIEEYDYHTRAAHYSAFDVEFEGRAPADVDDYFLIVIENDGHYPVRTLRLLPGAIDIGISERRSRLAMIANALTTDEWPSYPDELEDVGLPAWKMAQYAGGDL